MKRSRKGTVPSLQVVYASSACSKRRFHELFSNKERMPGQQAQKYHRLMLEGLARNGIQVLALSGAPVTRKNCRAGIISPRPDRDGGVEYRYLRVLNFPILKNIAILAQSFAKTCGYLRTSKDAVVICDVLNFSVSTGALLAAKLFRRPNTGIVTDVPRLLSSAPNPLITWAIDVAMRRYDSYVFLTAEMDSLINRRKVPSIVIEGQVDINMQDQSNELASKHPERVCLYAGTIDKRYGLETLVQGFLLARSRNCELHVYGRGDYERTLMDVARKQPRIKYLGPVPNDRVVQEQRRATLLVNPRPSDEEFAKYSFPSKNMEYMASGTPMLTTLLPGMPDEYLPHVYVLRDETAKGMAAAIDTLLSLDAGELHRKGREAKKFVLQNKNNVIQARRVVELVTACRGRATRDGSGRGDVA